MKKVVLSFFIILSLFIYTLPACAQQSNTSLFIKAKQLSLNGSYKEAAEVLKNILKNEKSMYIYDFLIENQLNAGLIDDALESSKQAVHDFPKEAKYLHLTASIYKTYKNNTQAAYEYMENCLNIAGNIADNPDYALNTALLASELKKYKRALEITDELIKKGPENSQYYIVRADIYSAQNKKKQAVKDLEKSIKIDNNSTAKLMLAELYLMQNNEEKAVKLLEEVSSDNENISAIIEQNIGKIYTESGNFDKAIEVYKRLAGKLYGKSKAIILMQLGDVLNKSGRYEEAGQVFEELTTLAPDETINYYIAGKFYEYTKNYEKAEKMYLGALNINPTYAQTLKRLAVVYLLQDRTKDALKYINMIDELERDVDYYLLKAECYSIEKDNKTAMVILEDALKENPTNTQVLVFLASLYEEAGNIDRTLELVKKALEIEPENPIFQNFLGFMYAEMGTNLDEALVLIEKALKKEPENGAYLDSLGWVYYKKKDYKKAYKYITEALKYMPEEKELQDHLDAVKKAMGK